MDDDCCSVQLGNELGGYPQKWEKCFVAIDIWGTAKVSSHSPCGTVLQSCLVFTFSKQQKRVSEYGFHSSMWRPQKFLLILCLHRCTGPVSDRTVEHSFIAKAKWDSTSFASMDLMGIRVVNQFLEDSVAAAIGER